MRLGVGALALLSCAGCKAVPTSLEVFMQSWTGQAQNLSVSLLRTTDAGMSSPIGGVQTIHRADGKPITASDTFLILLNDALAGQIVTVHADASPGEFGEGSTSVDRGRTARVDLHFQSAPPVDLLGELATDGTPQDLGDDGGPEIGVPDDLAGLDATLGMPDLAQTRDLQQCTPGCDKNPTPNLLYQCSDAGQEITSCTFGCATGSGCVRPNTCSAADISVSGTYRDNIADLMNDGAGSCMMPQGPTATFHLAPPNWATVTIDTEGSSFDTGLWARAVCNDPASELPLAGPCNPGAAGTTCSDDISMKDHASKLTLCGVPPVDLFIWLGVKVAGTGGPYRLNVNIDTSVTLNSCDKNAGMLIDGLLLDASTAQHVNNFSSDGTGACGMDKGNSSPDAVFYFTLLAPHDVTITTNSANLAMPFKHSTYVRKSACGTADVACDFGAAGSTMIALPKLAPATYFVIVDGTGGATGDFQIRLAIN